MPLDDLLLVCARFEPTRLTPLWPAGLVDVARRIGATEDDGDSKQEGKCKLDIGERVKLPQSLLTTAERATDSGEVWVRAERENPANERAFPKVRPYSARGLLTYHYLLTLRLPLSALEEEYSALRFEQSIPEMVLQLRQ